MSQSVKDILSKASVMGIIAIILSVIYVITLTAALFKGIIDGDTYIKAMSPLVLMILSFYFGAKTVGGGGGE